MPESALGEYLKACRADVSPAAVGLIEHGVRKVAGLRREEVAVAAAVSVDYYTRLEQGRELHPSAQVLDALARAFDLEDDARDHLFHLADRVAHPRQRAPKSSVSAELLQLMDSWSATPAFIISPALDLLARNELAAALYSDFDPADNLLRMTFVDPAGPQFFDDWERAAETTVANLRQAVGADGRDARLRELLAELESASSRFRELWSRQRVRGKTRDAKVFHHSEVGTLTLTHHAFDVRSAPGQQLIVYAAPTGSDSADALALLGSLAATRRLMSREPT